MTLHFLGGESKEKTSSCYWVTGWRVGSTFYCSFLFLQDAPLPVITGVITRYKGYFTPVLAIYFRPFLGAA